MTPHSAGMTTCFLGLTVFLALIELAREEDVFEIKDCEVFIFH